VRVGAIENPGAGARGAGHVLPAVERFVERYADHLRTISCKPTDRIEALSRRLAAAVDQIIVVGGDGTLNGVVNGILKSTNPDVGVTFLPAGRGGDSARTLPSLTRADLERARIDWHLQRLDAGSVQTNSGVTTRFIKISSVGLGAAAARIASRLPRLPGTTCYLIGAAGGLLKDPAVDVQLCIDGHLDVTLDACHLIAVANGRYFGGGLHIAPMALPDDGFLDIVTVSGASRFEILRNIPRVFTGAHMSHPAIQHWKVNTLTVNARPAIGVETDGEVLGVTSAALSVLPAALNWMVLR
jgi:diacylglycerol kinase (ATP)